MNEEKRDIIYIAVMVAGIAFGAYIGGMLGYEERELVGMVIGGLAGGFVGFVAALLVSPLILPGMIVFIIAGPIALGIVVLYYVSKN